MKSVTVMASITILRKSEVKTTHDWTKAEKAVLDKVESWTTPKKMKMTKAVGVLAAFKTLPSR
jgi:hypothetical protein